MNDALTIGLDASNLREGGGVTHLVELLAAACPQEHGIGRVVVWGDENTLARLPKRPWLVERSPAEMKKGQMVRARWQHRKLAAEARVEGCDLLFSPGGNYTGGFRPFVTMSRNMLPFDKREVARYGLSLKRLRLELLRRLQTRSFRRADGLIFLTDYARETVLSMIGPVRGRVDTIPHGVSSDFAPPPRRFRSIDECSPSDPFRLIYVSHASPYKHQWHVTEAVAKLRQRLGWPLRLDLIGPRSVAESVACIDETIDKVDGAGEWVTFHGPMPRSRLIDYLIAADIGIFASSCENMPNILLEKMAAGLPIISSDRGPMPEVLANAGLLFDPERPDMIADVLQQEITTPSLRQRHSAMAVTRASEFQWQRCADDTFAFLRQVAEGTAPRPNMKRTT
ncbi:glycosyltransferase [Sphingopyxis panaciterrae]